MSGTSQWEVSGWTIGSAVNLNPAIPPVTGWQILGTTTPYTITEFTVSEGSCDSLDILRYDLTINQPTCECNGSIIFNVIDGVPPYQYSVDGFTYFTSPIFNNLCSGLYPTRVIDSSGQTFTNAVSLSLPPAPQIYTVDLSLNVTGNAFNITTTPTLPVGASITFDLVHTTNFEVAPNTSVATYNGLTTVNVNSLPVPYTTVSTNGTSTPLTKLCVGGVTTSTNKIYTWQNITMTQGTTVNGTITNVITPITLEIPCYYTNSYYLLSINNARILNCPCCSVVVINPGTGIGKV
jgi:hypothetical protein